ncbi:hypothetical protein GQX73_g9335 [Xylaria multiplex]|uniref:F-box domain-containing protein n=1 Tax=Xylaria multiplex TaxID=323545 RepID=A0A7C8IQW2_9PEZI|nr:hypothetical protein GQX73_g9335 [Xylaria multiplex]
MSTSSTSQTMTDLGNQRLLLDIHELTTKPYPKITLHPREDDIHKACLVLYPDNCHPLHLNIRFSERYPVSPPSIRMDSSVEHPNVFGSFICASILRFGDEYTPAYTLKGIAIQLLSFFDSESLDQEHGLSEDLTRYREMVGQHVIDTYTCGKCGFGGRTKPQETKAPSLPTSFNACVDHNHEEWPMIQNSLASVRSIAPKDIERLNLGHSQMPLENTRKIDRVGFYISRLPNELLLLIIENLEDFEHLTNFSRAWPRISQVVRDFNVIRQRELQCFCLKKGYQSAKLGVGVTVDRGQISSEFDLVSEEAYTHMNIRSSIHNIRFQYWLPLPISRRHWNQVREGAHGALAQIAFHPKARCALSDLRALFTFMNDVVVRLNKVTEETETEDSKKSTLRHASEKAIESYFHLFHLLVCLATEDPSIIQQANTLLRGFEDGKRGKAYCSNLGHLLIALLISDIKVTDVLIKSIITEAITRNVVWLLDRKGAGKAELSYMERDAVSAYRLHETFQGSLTSYRLLMFSELFRRTARPSHEKPLNQVLDELFDRHGGPPQDAASHLAAEVRRLRTIDNFPAFMREMGLQSIPTPMNFTSVLRDTVRKSMDKGYSRWAISQRTAMHLRIKEDPHIQLTKEERQSVPYVDYRSASSYNFFPNTH